MVGFLLAPIAPSLLFSFGALVVGASSGLLLELPISGLALGFFIWFVYAIAVAYPATFIIGIPGYLIYQKNGLTSFKSYLTGGVILGALAPLLLMPVFGVSATLNFDYWIFIISSVFGAATCVTFWMIVIKTPKNT